MQSGGGAAGNGRNPGPPPPPGRSSSSASASPSSSSSAVSAPTHLGFESIHQQQQQQQLAFRQSQQQQQQQQLLQQHLWQETQQLRKVEREDALLAYQSSGVHGVTGGSNFPSSSSAMPLPQLQKKNSDLRQLHGAPQRGENQIRGQGVGQHLQNPLHQAYLQFALQAAQQKSHGNLLMQQQGKIGIVGPSGREQDIANNLKMQDLMSLRAASQLEVPMFNKTAAGHYVHGEKNMEQGQTSNDKRNELKPPSLVATGQLVSSNMVRPVQSLQSHSSIQGTTNMQFSPAQMEAIQTWAQEHNIDLSVPANVTLMTQLLPMWHSARAAQLQKHNETNTGANQSSLPSSKQQISSSPVGSESSGQANSLSDASGQAGSVKSCQTLPSLSILSGGPTAAVNSNNLQMQKQLAAHGRENQTERAGKSPIIVGNGGPLMQLPQSSGSMNQGVENLNAKNAITGHETMQMQHFRLLQQSCRPVSQPVAPSSEGVGVQVPPQGGSVQMPGQQIGFTKQQLHVLKAQILAFRRLKRGERVLPPEVLQAIAPPLLDLQSQQASLSSGMVNQGRPAVNNIEGHARHIETNDKEPQFAFSSQGHMVQKEESSTGEENVAVVSHKQGAAACSLKHPVGMVSFGNVEHNHTASVKSEQEVERGKQNISSGGDHDGDKGKSMPMNSAVVDAGQVKKPISTCSTPLSKDVGTRKYQGPLFDFPSFTRKPDSLGSTTANYSSNLSLAYDVKDLLFEEGMDVLNKKRTENLKKISSLLAVNLERKRIRPDNVLRLQIEERKLRLLDFQARLRDEVDLQQQGIMTMSERPYRKFVRQCERQRVELIRQVQQLQKASREKQLKSVFQWRKKLLEAHWGIRDARTARNRGVAKYHERMLREFSKKKDDGRNKRMEALKNNDVDRYREMLLEQQTNVPGDAAQRYDVLSSFLSQTEEYLHKLGGKITAAKDNQEVEEAANAAAKAARSQGLSEEEAKAAAACAREEVMIRKRFSEMNSTKDHSSVNKYYNLAHAVNEKVLRQPSILRAGTLRDYQLVGLQWMLSLYNNKLNGILADEMGLGKTVQVMALIAYLMEFKGNYGPHLIIVPNAVLVNWKSELLNWLPSMKCIFYVGGKDQRSKLFSHEVVSVKFNILVTTYEFVMYDRSKLSKINWKYIIIDEAQRMKDRESVLARDLDRYHCQRRLLLTGTPLQNDLKELWSLLNLLLPEVFDNRKAFHDWFAKPFQKDGSHTPEEDDWLETEKKVIIIHRLHQILEPFMLRRRVEDVEGSLPRKVSIVLRCKMSAIQGAIYDWIKATGTVRVDPEDELRRVEKNPLYQVKTYKNLNNKCMELRKVCNHPLLNYPYFNDYSKEFIVRSCGKLWVLDRILVKLERAGHRVLLFSTMTKLLDLLEEYLQWRRLVYRRIDGTTSLEDRESAIVDFNRSNSDCFIFLLSIRAAGRGLNLQTADTVVIYDPDPNPQNEEQAVARAHRIGQTREVKVIYMEAVVDKISGFQKEDELRNGGTGDLEDDLVGKDRYMGSIESLIRNNIQQYKIDMADEVINAGRFDQRTTHEERRMTLETLLHDEERYQETLHDVPSLQEVNRMIARSEEEVELFDQMDEEFDWTREMVRYNEVPKWLRAGSQEVSAVAASLSKKSAKNILTSNIGFNSSETISGLSPSRSERRRGRPRVSTGQKDSIYRELDDEDGEDSEDSSEGRNAYLLHEEEGEIGEFEDELNGAVDVPQNNKDLSEEEGLVCDGGGYDSSQVIEACRSVQIFEEAGSTGSSGSRRLPQPATPSMSSQRFGSLSALDARPASLSKRTPDELEEGEIAVSGDSHLDLQQSGSWIHDRDDGEEEQVLQPKLKRKRSMRLRHRYTGERLEEKSNSEWIFSQRGPQILQEDRGYDMQQIPDQELEAISEPVLDRIDMSATSLDKKRNLPSRKVLPVIMQKSGSLSFLSGSADDAIEQSRGSWSGKALGTGGRNFHGMKMSDSTQRKCKNVISKLQRRINKDGHQVVPTLSDLLKKKENSSFDSPAIANNLLDLKRIEQRVDSSEYNGVTDFIADVQLMLKNVARHHTYSHEVRNEAGKLQDLFFDIMKIAFPDTDFREARNAVSFAGPGGASVASSPKQQAASSESKRHAQPINKVEPTSGLTKAICPVPVDDEGRRGYASSKFPKDSMGPSGTGNAREKVLPEGAPLLAHPGDLVICKKKRKDRDKQRIGPASPLANYPGRVGPFSPPDTGRVAPMSPSLGRNVRGTSLQKGSYSSQQAIRPTGRASAASTVEEVQWAKPVKRMRTDTGKRRPSNL